MRTEGFKGAMLSTLLMVSLMAPAISLLFTGPASASNPNGWGISYYADNSSDSYMAKAIISSATPYEHIILIVVDGMRPDVLVEADTPNIDNLTASGSFTWNAWTVTPSVTIAAIPSIFTGATPEVHGVTDWDGEIYAETIVEVFEEAGLPCAIVGEDPILGGYSATYCTGYYSHPEADENFTSTAIEWFIEYRPFFLTLYNPMPDRRGHAYGHESSEYREVIENADYHIGRLVENLKELGVYESTLIVITPDHGMTGTSHGYGYENDMRIFSIWHGPGVKENYQMVDNVYIPASGNYDETYVAHRIIDIAPTITSLVGLGAPENSEGNIIYQIFEDQIFENPTPHTPILIVGNDNFTPANGVVSGSGTENDPYIIENWDINAENAHGIEIRNTTAYFVIRNCYVHDEWVNYKYGIYFDNVRNGKIDNNVAGNNYFGIYLYNSDNNLISNNLMESNSIGIRLIYSNNNLMENNLMENNNWSGMYLYFSNNNLMENNLMENNADYGIRLDFSGNNLVTNNIVENNAHGISIRYADNNLIDNNLVNNNNVGIFFYNEYYLYKNLVTNNLVENNNHGIYIYSSDCTLRGNVLRNNAYEFHIEGWELTHYLQDIDNSNTIDGKPIYYLIGESNLVFDGSFEVGFLGLVESENIWVENLQTFGILFFSTSKSTVTNSTVTRAGRGIHLSGSYNNLISNNLVENNYQGISLYNSDNNLLENNTVGNNDNGISLDLWSDNNTLQNNTCLNNEKGIGIYYSRNVKMRNNTLSNNHYNFGVDSHGYIYQHFVHDIDPSNLVNGKPIRYLVDNKNEIIGPSLDTGYLALVNSDNILVENLALENNWQGILLAFTENSRVENLTLKNNSYGIYQVNSSNNTLQNNTCENNSRYGIYLWYNSNNNLIYHNNFVNNRRQASDDSSNYWDNGYPSGGNYWSDYTGADYYRGENQDIYGSDGIGDTQYYISGAGNQNRYPSMNPFPLPWTGWVAFWGLETIYSVRLEKNLDIYQGSKLVVKFYTYGDAFENENVIETFTPPAHVEENESARHPNKCVKKARLDLTTDNTENVISTIASFIVRKTHLEMRFVEIPLEWALTPPDSRIIVEQEFMDLPSQWAIAPP